jgi:hypothetical protein
VRRTAVLSWPLDPVRAVAARLMPDPGATSVYEIKGTAPQRHFRVLLNIDAYLSCLLAAAAVGPNDARMNSR